MQPRTYAVLLLISLSACQAEAEPAATPTGDAGNAEWEEPSANPALGRWVEQSGSCADLRDVQFTATEVLRFTPGGGAEGLPVTYSERDGNRILATAGTGKQVVITRTDADHLTLSTPDGKKDCRLVRR